MLEPSHTTPPRRHAETADSLAPLFRFLYASSRYLIAPEGRQTREPRIAATTRRLRFEFTISATYATACRRRRDDAARHAISPATPGRLSPSFAAAYRHTPRHQHLFSRAIYFHIAREYVASPRRFPLSRRRTRRLPSRRFITSARRHVIDTAAERHYLRVTMRRFQRTTKLPPEMPR